MIQTRIKLLILKTVVLGLLSFNIQAEVNQTYLDTHDGYRHASLKRPTSAKDYNYFVKNQGKSVMLSFDCSWVEPNKGLDILDALKRQKVKATFFIASYFILKKYSNGLSPKNIKWENAELIRRIIEDGHEVANHTVTHRFSKGKKLALKNVDWSWELGHLELAWNYVVKNIFNGESVPKNSTLQPFWRAPFGESDEVAFTEAARAGFPFHIGWNVDVADTISSNNCNDLKGSSTKPTPGKNCLTADMLTKRVLQYSRINKNSLDNIVVLAHLSNNFYWGSDPRGLEHLIESMKDFGYKFSFISDRLAYKLKGNKIVPYRQ